MNYKGYEIKDEVWHTVETDWRDLGSNYFDFDKEDLQEMIEALDEKEKELKSNGVVFKNLTLSFWATEYHSNDYGPDDESGCEVSFRYQVPESEDEKKQRIDDAKKRIDEEIQKKEKMLEDNAKQEAAKKEREIALAKATLEKYGILI